MINTRIAYKDVDGNVSVVCPTPEFIENGGTMAQFLERSVPDGVIFEELHKDDIPSDRYFRNAWKLDAGISVDRAKAEAIHMFNLRVQRDEMLSELDVPFQRALESKDVVEQDVIAAKKNALRDMPQNVDMSLLDTPDKIKAFMPDVLV
jgi:hypothetical protein